MKKLTYLISIFTLIALIVGCSGDSYQKRLDKEKKAIKQFLADEGIDVIQDESRIFDLEPNQYYLEGSTGVYMQVVHPGDLTDVPKDDKDKDGKVNIRTVYLSFDSLHYMVTDDWADGRSQYIPSISFEYMNSNTYGSGLGTTVDQIYMSPSLVLPIEKGIGNGAIVNIIVPFTNGSAYQTSYYEPFRFVGLEYTFKPKHTGGDEDDKKEE